MPEIFMKCESCGQVVRTIYGTSLHCGSCGHVTKDAIIPPEEIKINLDETLKQIQEFIRYLKSILQPVMDALVIVMENLPEDMKRQIQEEMRKKNEQENKS